MSESLILVGFPSAGKSHWGLRWAQEQGCDFIDSDAWITEQTGQTPGSLIAQKGEAFFRQLELEFIQKVLPDFKGIVSTGGGMPCSEQRLAALQKCGKLLWLNPSFELLLERMQAGKHELLERKGLAGLEALWRERKEYYSRSDWVLEQPQAESLNYLPWL